MNANEITWDTFDETTRIWMRVLAALPEEAVVRALRLDLNTGVVTLMGAGRDRVLGHIGEDRGRATFFPLKSWSPVLDPSPIPYVSEYVHSIAMAVYYSALYALVGNLPLRWDDYDGLGWVTKRLSESIYVGTTDLRELRDEIRRVAAQCWAAEFIGELERRVPVGVTRESSPRATRYLTGGNGDVEIVTSPDDYGLLDVYILDREGYGPRYHLAYGSPDVDDALDRAVRFLKDRCGHNKKEESDDAG